MERATGNVIEIEDVGAIETLVIPVRPGVTVLRGSNGAGKSTAILCIDALRGGKPRLTARDGSAAGYIRGPGKVIHVGPRTNRSGDLSMPHVSGGLDVRDLVDPRFESDVVADEHRARFLCSLLNLEPTIDLFADIVPAEFLATLKESIEPQPNLTDLAKKVKRALEVRAQALEGEAAAQLTLSRSAIERASGASEDEPHDEAALSAEYQARVREHTLAEGEARGAAARATTWAAAKAEFDKMVASGAPTQDSVRESFADTKARNATALTEAEEELRACAAAYDAASAEEERLQKLLDEAKAAKTRCKAAGAAASSKVRVARNTIENAERAEKAALESARAATDALERVKAIVEAGTGDAGPSAADLAAMKARVDAADAAVKRGAIVREKLEAARAGAQHQKAHEEKAEAALTMRERARSCFDVVFEAVGRTAPMGLRWRNGRLTLPTDRGDEVYADLSEGERWRVGFQALIFVTGRGGIVSVPQDAWEGIQPARRRELDELAYSEGVMVVTGEADDDDLRAEVFNKARTA